MCSEVVVCRHKNITKGTTDVACLIGVVHSVAKLYRLLPQFRLDQSVGQLAVKILGDEAGAAAGDVDQFAHQVAVDALHEVVEVEVEILHTRTELGSEVVTQIFGTQVIEIAARV